MGGFQDALTEILTSHGEYGADMGAYIDDPAGYFGVDVFSYEGMADALVNGPNEFQTDAYGFVENPTLAGGLGLIPGTGGIIDTGLTVLDDLVDVPSWVAGGTEPVPVASPTATPSQPPVQGGTDPGPTSYGCCCCCCCD